MTTEYKIALEKDINSLHEALHRWNAPNPDRPIGHPTIFAVRDGIIVGLIVTSQQSEAVVCDRLYVDPTLPRVTRGIILKRLCEHYEILLGSLGMAWYHIHTDTQDNILNGVLGSSLGSPYHQDHESTWYRREIA